MQIKPAKGKIDANLLTLLSILILIGLFMIGDISLIEAEVKFGDKFHFLKRQFAWVILGSSLCFFTAKIDYLVIKRTAKLFFVLSLIPLLLLLIPGVGVTIYGAKRWFDLGFMNFQPVELVKLSSIIYFSSLAVSENKKTIWQQLLILSVPSLLILVEPDFGSLVLLVSSVGLIWFLAGKSLLQLSLLVIVGLAAGGLLIFTSPYRTERVLGLVNPFYDPQDKSYHVYQLVLTLGSGGWFGRGMGNSRQKYQFLPEATTDSIVALMAEEFGFLGIFLFLFLFALFLFRCFRVARLAPDPFCQLLSAGIAGLIAFQSIINLGAVAVLFPLTGMPFPFVSYGGSSLITLMAAMGILLNISRYQDKKCLRKS
ncbi:MAG: putative peptidoglycan glycosyltransferase FtsW [Patescibacteria group bacterium]|nr:putative lipid II flippase FtsW [Patescibacteria group bacterium]